MIMIVMFLCIRYAVCSLHSRPNVALPSTTTYN